MYVACFFVILLTAEESINQPSVIFGILPATSLGLLLASSIRLSYDLPFSAWPFFLEGFCLSFKENHTISQT